MSNLKSKIYATKLYHVYKSGRRFIDRAYRRVKKYYTLKIKYPKIYNQYAEMPVNEQKILFIELRLPKLTNSFKVLYDELQSNYDFDIHCHFLRNTFVSGKEYEQRCIDMVKDIATAKYVFVNESSNVIGTLDLRPETILTQTWHACGAFKKFGFSTAEMIFGDNRKNMLKYPMNRNYTYVTISSPEIKWAYAEAFNMKDNPDQIIPIGTSRTDVFYDKNFIQSSFEKLHAIMPSSINKKVLLYAPTFRGRVAKAKTPDVIDVAQYEKEIGDEYVLLFKHHPLVRIPPVIDEAYSEFAMDVTNALSIEELLCVSDICISDYSSLVFEYSIFERPMIFLAHDLEEYFDWRGFYYDYYELAPGPIVSTNEEIIDYVKNIETSFDKEKVQAFRNKFMSACDGNATKRIMDKVFGDSLEKYARLEPVPGVYHLIPNSNVTFHDVAKQLKEMKSKKEKIQSIYESAVKNYADTRDCLMIVASEAKELRNLDYLSSKDMEITCSAKKYLVEKLQEQLATKGLVLNVAYESQSINKHMIEKIASAKYIFALGTVEMLNSLSIRKESKVIYLPKEAFSFMSFDYGSNAYKIGLLNDAVKEIPMHGTYQGIAIASREMKNVYKNSLNQAMDKDIYLEIGGASLEPLLDETFRKNCLNELYDKFPKAKDKKIILYSPTPRLTKSKPEKNLVLNFGELFEKCRKDYVVLYDYKWCEDEDQTMYDELKSFVFVVNGIFDSTKLMAMADVFIGDYKKESFEFAVKEKPILLYAPDYKYYFNEMETNFNYETIAPGDIYVSEKEIYKLFENETLEISEKTLNFKKKFLPYSDGKMVSKLIEKVIL